MTEEELRKIEERMENFDHTSINFADEALRALIAEVRRLTTCSCGRPLTRGLCNICDDDS